MAVFFRIFSHWLVIPGYLPWHRKNMETLETIQRYSGLVDTNDTQMREFSIAMIDYKMVVSTTG